jgi:hypothetical protein
VMKMRSAYRASIDAATAAEIVGYLAAHHAGPGKPRAARRHSVPTPGERIDRKRGKAI